jgi:phenylpropionate dioxygenase-like ring-hydroxylating dioxygenase large terminal subunit
MADPTSIVVNRPDREDFRVHRSAMVDPDLLVLERQRIFDRCWIYAGHESEVRAPGDFVTRTLCERPVILCRDSANKVRVFLNVCRHRGALVCRERSGNAKGYYCFYHGWRSDRDGCLDGVPGRVPLWLPISA